VNETAFKAKLFIDRFRERSRCWFSGATSAATT
jgi:hypothetical protein